MQRRGDEENWGETERGKEREKRQREIKKEKGGMTGWRRVRERYRKRKEDKTKIIGRERDRKRKRKGERERGGEKKNDRMDVWYIPGGCTVPRQHSIFRE